jgi:acetyl esterase/lipase
MNVRRWIVRSLVTLALVFVLALGAAAAVWWYFHPRFESTPSVRYSSRKGHDLVMDVLRPADPNGAGILVLLSGSWKSGRDAISPLVVAPLLRRGYTIFAVHHGSQPEFTVMEIIEDVRRAVRFVRHHAGDYGVDPQRLGVSGGSSGGHLSLMIATLGGPGRPDAPDPVDRESDAVQAVAIFFPVTDLLNLGTSTENAGDGGPPKSYVKAFGPDATNLTRWKVIGRETSPIYHVTTNLPPVLIIHGDADTLTPLEQSEWFVARATEAGRSVELVVRRGKGHGWPTMVWDVREIARWYDRHLGADGRRPGDASAPVPSGEANPVKAGTR